MQDNSNKINKFCIILLIASPGKRYNLFKKILIKFMNSNENFRTFFIYGKVNKNKIIKSDYDLFFNINESYKPGIFNKTIKAMKYINKYYNYKFIIRTNLSTFWRLDKLYKFLNKIDDPYFCGGSIRKNNTPLIHITGTGIIFSQKISILLSYFFKKNINNKKVPDDVLFTRILKKKFKIHDCLNRNEDYVTKNVIYKKDNQNNIITNINTNDFYFRLKTNNKDNLIDCFNMKKLYDFFYEKI